MLVILHCNDNKIVDGNKLQIMRCMICHVNFVPFNPRTKERRGIITHIFFNGITTLKKHVDVDHAILAKKIKEKLNSPLGNVLEKQPAKKRPNVFNFEISEFCGVKDHFKNVVKQKQFLQDLALLVVKNISLFNLLRALG